MFEKTLVFALLTLISNATLADDESLEPCINGEVSSTGSFPTQEMEDQIHAYLRWRTSEPFYLFQAAENKVSKAYPEN